jgi:hypothetical protein
VSVVGTQLKETKEWHIERRQERERELNSRKRMRQERDKREREGRKTLYYGFLCAG